MRLFLVIAGSLLALAAPAAQAGLLSNGTITRDVETGVEYYDVGLTQAQSIGSWVNFGTWESNNAAAPGFHLATDAEALGLLAAVGLGPGATGIAAFAPATLLLDFVGPGVASSPITTEMEMVTQEVLGGLDLRSYRIQAFDSPIFEGLVSADSHAFNLSAAGRGALLARSYANGTAASALAASVMTSSQLQFAAADGQGIWFDFTDFRGDVFGVQAPSAAITHVGVDPTFGDADGQITFLDPDGGMVTLGPGGLHAFSSPVASLTVSGVSGGAGAPTGGAAGPAGIDDLPLFLRFDQGVTDVVATVPEPAPFLLVGFAALSLARARRSPGAQPE